LFDMVGYFIPYFQMSGKAPDVSGAVHPTLVPLGNFPTKDGYLAIAATTNVFWENTCRALSRPEWMQDPRFSTKEVRQQHRVELVKLMSEITRQKTTAEWDPIFRAHDVPWGPVLGIPDLLDHPQVQARGLLQRLGIGPLTAPVNPFRCSEVELSVRKAPPRVGEDTVTVLRERLGMDEQQIASLLKRGIVAQAPPAAQR
jgi:crotonobetainyl-CoA:carnitine CoA-transferase CaiB-like acyl-CoA transferase